MTLASSPVPPAEAFTAAQKEFLQGFMAGLAASGQLPFVGHTTDGRITAGPADAATANLAGPVATEPLVHGTPLSDLCKEERWKHDENPLDAWERLLAHADADKFPDAENTYRFKTHGLFYVAPAQDSFMLRLRVPGCELHTHQLHGLADLAGELGGGSAHVTTRGNLQIREFKPAALTRVLTRVQELGLTSRGAGADNIRNITASPTSGFDPGELLDVRPYAKALHHYILNHRDLYGLPRKFNVAFDSGGSVSAAADTNDIGFLAVRVTEQTLAAAGAPAGVAPGVYFRVLIGGITGHRDFARDIGVLVRPSESVAVAAAMIRVFAENGDRTNRKKARLKYLLERWGDARFVEESARRLAFPLLRLPSAGCEPRRPVEKHGWLGVRRQAQRGRNSVGVGIPVGRMSAKQMHGLAHLAETYGNGELRLTVWQTVIIPHIADAFAETVRRAAVRLGFFTEASGAAGGIVACTGNKGCKYAASDTKGHGLALFKHLQSRFPEITSPVNIHFTGCPHSCAQHYCGDIGFVGTRLQDGSEGYHMVVGGGMDHEQRIAPEILRGVRASEVNATVDKLLSAYLASREGSESFHAWSVRHTVGQLQEKLSA